MKLGYHFLYILSFVFIVSCSAEDDDSGTTTPPVTQQPAPAPTPQVPSPGKSSLSAPENNEVCYEGEEVDAINSEVTFSWDQIKNDGDTALEGVYKTVSYTHLTLPTILLV